MLSGDIGHPGIRLYAEQDTSPGDELPGGDTGSDEVVDQLCRIRRPRTVELDGVLTERPGATAVLMDHDAIVAQAGSRTEAIG